MREREKIYRSDDEATQSADVVAGRVRRVDAYEVRGRVGAVRDPLLAWVHPRRRSTHGHPHKHNSSSSSEVLGAEGDSGGAEPLHTLLLEARECDDDAVKRGPRGSRLLWRRLEFLRLLHWIRAAAVVLEVLEKATSARCRVVGK